MYLEMLEELITLLHKCDNDHWAKWFQIAHDQYCSGKALQSYSRVLGAYGGMGSFNDVFCNLPQDEHDRLEYLKEAIWKYAKGHS